MTDKIETTEEEKVILHAALLGRADITKNAITALKTGGKYKEEEIARIISTTNSEDGATPLHIASKHGHTDVIRALLNTGARLDIHAMKGDYANKRPYELANEKTRQTFHVYFFEQIAMGNVNAVENLLLGGVPVDIKDESSTKDSSMHWACSFGHLEVVQILLTYGFPINTTNEIGQSGLHIAAKGHFFDVVLLLMEEGADSKHADAQGKLPKDYSKDGNITCLLNSEITPTRVYTNMYLQKHSHTTELKDNTELAHPVENKVESKASEEKDIVNETERINSLQEVINAIDKEINDFSDDTANEANEINSHGICAVKHSPKANFSSDFESSKPESDACEQLRESISQLLWPPIAPENIICFPEINSSSSSSSAKSLTTSIGQCVFHEEEILNIAIPIASTRPSLLHSVSHSFSFDPQDNAAGIGAHGSTHTNGNNNNNNLLAATNKADYDEELLSLLTWSGIVETMENYNVQVQFTTNTTISRVVLAIDNQICYTLNSYQLIITSKGIRILGYNNVALLYGIHTLLQLIHHISELSFPRSQFTQSNKDEQSKDQHITSLSLPTMCIQHIVNTSRTTALNHTIPVRSILWSYRQYVRLSSEILIDYIELLSKLLITRIYFILDPVEEDTMVVQNHHNTNHLPHSASEVQSMLHHQMHKPHTDGRLTTIHEICKKYGIELVPHVVFTSTKQRLPEELLKKFLSQSSQNQHQDRKYSSLLSISFLLDDPRKQSHTDGEEHAMIHEHTAFCRRVITQCSASGGGLHAAHSNMSLFGSSKAHTATAAAPNTLQFKTIQLSSSVFIQSVIRPLNIAWEEGVNAYELPLDILYPQSLMMKPLICLQSHLQAIQQYIQHVKAQGSSIAVYPAFLDRDFVYPILLLKYFTIFFAGFAWSYDTTTSNVFTSTTTTSHPALHHPTHHYNTPLMERLVQYFLSLPAASTEATAHTTSAAASSSNKPSATATTTTGTGIGATNTEKAAAANNNKQMMHASYQLFYRVLTHPWTLLLPTILTTTAITAGGAGVGVGVGVGEEHSLASLGMSVEEIGEAEHQLWELLLLLSPTITAATKQPQPQAQQPQEQPHGIAVDTLSQYLPYHNQSILQLKYATPCATPSSGTMQQQQETMITRFTLLYKFIRKVFFLTSWQIKPTIMKKQLQYNMDGNGSGSSGGGSHSLHGKGVYKTASGTIKPSPDHSHNTNTNNTNTNTSIFSWLFGTPAVSTDTISTTTTTAPTHSEVEMMMEEDQHRIQLEAWLDDNTTLLRELEEYYGSLHLLSIVARLYMIAYATIVPTLPSTLPLALPLTLPLTLPHTLPPPPPSSTAVVNIHHQSSSTSSSTSSSSTVDYLHRFQGLSVGKKSDISNALLEGIHYHAYLWKLRYEYPQLLFPKLQYQAITFPTSTSPTIASTITAQPLQPSDEVAAAENEAVLQLQIQLYPEPQLPGMVLLHLLSESLIQPKSLEEYIQHIFTHG